MTSSAGQINDNFAIQRKGKGIKTGWNSEKRGQKKDWTKKKIKENTTEAVQQITDD